MKAKILLGVVGGVLVLGALHVWINVGFDKFTQEVGNAVSGERKEFTIGFLPVTCHLTCPVVDWTNVHSSSGALYTPKRYSEFPTMCEDLSNGTLQGAFLNAPLTIALVQKGVPVKLVSLGHRDGSAIVVATNSHITEFKQLKGKRMLIPSKFSNQQLWLQRLCKENGMQLSELTTLACPPPDMPAMLASGSADAYCVGEPHCARAEMDGSGRVLLQAKDSWPGFISCAFVVRQDALDTHRELIQEVVNGIAGSGLWLEQGVDNRFAAADVVGSVYYNQKPELLKWVLSKPVDRVRYDDLAPEQGDFDEIMQIGIEIGMFKEPLAFERYVDASFHANVPHKPIPMPPNDGQGRVVAVAAAKPPAPAANPAAPAAPSAAPASNPAK
ncbi:MAG: ABC transporter substrate-binding protein [Planctomycetota bacterium]|nr:MAG: ABC transporter substrate-binding protein [Planctomycetota bacterium]